MISVAKSESGQSQKPGAPSNIPLGGRHPKTSSSTDFPGTLAGKWFESRLEYKLVVQYGIPVLQTVS